MPRSRGLLVLYSCACALAVFSCKSGDDDEDGPMVINQGGAGDGAGAGGGASEAGAGGDGAMAGGGAGAVGGDAPGAGAGGGSTAEVDGGTTLPPEQVPLDELPDAFADAICSALLDCVGPSKLQELTEREDCVTAVGAELRAKDFAYMDDAIAAGHVLYDPAQLAACEDGIRELGCDVLTQTFPGPCVEVLEGNIANGGECLITAECEGTSFCTSGASCPSTCQPLLEAGGTCADDGQCGDGLACLAGECGALSTEGEPCSGDSGKACALGLSCVGSTDTVAGDCTTNDEVQAGALDESCEPGGILCNEGLSCVFNGGMGFHCQGAADTGEECYLGLPGQCANDEYCDTTEITEAGTCRALPGAGEDCVLGDLCLGGHVCVSDGMTATCREIVDNGEACSVDAECRSGHCTSDSCEPPPACL